MYFHFIKKYLLLYTIYQIESIVVNKQLVCCTTMSPLLVNSYSQPFSLSYCTRKFVSKTLHSFSVAKIWGNWHTYSLKVRKSRWWRVLHCVVQEFANKPNGSNKSVTIMDSKSIRWDCIAGKSDATFGIIVSASFKQIL